MNTFYKAVEATAANGSRERSDDRSRELVDHAIEVQETANTMAAVEYLKSHDVAAHVIARVLLDPERRRSTVPA